MTRGGARNGAGRKAARGVTKRVLTLLDARELAMLDALQEKRDESASDVLRAGLETLAQAELGDSLGKRAKGRAK